MEIQSITSGPLIDAIKRNDSSALTDRIHRAGDIDASELLSLSLRCAVPSVKIVKTILGSAPERQLAALRSQPFVSEAISGQAPLSVIHLLLERGFSPDAGCPLFFLAAYPDHQEEIIGLLVKSGAHVDGRWYGQTPLQKISDLTGQCARTVAMISCLLDHGADPCRDAQWGQSALDRMEKNVARWQMPAAVAALKMMRQHATRTIGRCKTFPKCQLIDALRPPKGASGVGVE